MKWLVTGMLLLSSSIAYADESDYELGEVQVTAGTNYQIQEKVTPQQYSNSAHIQETIPGFTSPYVGPFTGNQVDQVLNDVRTNNALFRSGPNQYYSWVPDAFVKEVRVSDGGNVGGTISRDLYVQPSHLGLSYNSIVNGFAESASFKHDKYGIAVYNIRDDNVDTAHGTVPNSKYNQIATLGEYNWNSSNKTTFLFSRSDDIRRTDKWNGGDTLSGYTKPRVYTYELQQYVFANHRFNYKDFDANLAYQRAEEDILDFPKKIRTMNNIATANIDYSIADNFSVYSVNNVEFIFYDNGTTKSGRLSNDIYATTKQGVRYAGKIWLLDVTASVGGKQVTISGFDLFVSPEASVTLGYNGFFFSYDHSTNSPGYAALKHSTTSGSGTSVPNPDLEEEVADTYRIGYTGHGLYVSAYKKQFSNAIISQTVAKNTYKPMNWGEIDVDGGTLGYSNSNLFDTGIGVESRLEMAYGNQSVYGSVNKQPISKTTLFSSYLNVHYMGLFTEWKCAPKDHRLSSGDRNDIRIYGHNKGYNIVNIGYDGKYKNIEYSLVVNNVFNDDGRVLGSSVDVAGRGVTVSAKYLF